MEHIRRAGGLARDVRELGVVRRPTADGRIRTEREIDARSDV